MKKRFQIFSLLTATLLLPIAAARAELIDFNDPNIEYKTEINARILPQFPPTLIQNGITEGQVKLMVEIDHFGELRDWIVVYASHPGFAAEVEQVIGTWDFKPPTLNGKPASVVRQVEVNFQSSGALISFDVSTGLINRMLGPEGRAALDRYLIASVDDLDRFPEPTEVVRPELPPSALEQAHGRVATFSFYIDTEGRPRLVSLTETDGIIDSAALVAAQDALQQWRFHPPTVDGRPVVIQIAQPFRFDLPNAASGN